MLEINNIRYIIGHINVIGHSNLVVAGNFDNSKMSPQNLSKFQNIVNNILPRYDKKPLKDLSSKFILFEFIKILELIFNSSKYPLLSKIKFKFSQDKFFIYIPILGYSINSVSELLKFFISILENNFNNSKNIYHNLIKLYEESIPKGANDYRILNLSYKNNIPYILINNNIYQLGMGSKSRLIRSTSTDYTPSIGRGICNNKFVTKKVLQSIGLPSSEGRLISSRKEAVDFCKQIGYPVVVKPIDKNGGVGVVAGINSENLMLKSYEQVKRISKNVMIEKHFEGNDYRIYIFNNELLYVAQRNAPTIKGNGLLTINELIMELNKSRENKDLQNAKVNIKFKTIEIDDELLEILEENNYTLNSILEKDKELKLRRITNVSTGGTSTYIDDMNIIHPDNIELAKRALNVLKLDMVVVDLLIPDISKSWLEVGACITELNSTPQMGSDEKLLYFLKKSIKDDGRIPSVVIVGENDNNLNNDIVNLLNKKDFNIGFTSKDLLVRNDKIISNIKTHSSYQSSLRLVCDPAINAMVTYVEDGSLFFNSGLAFDKIDILIILDNKKVELIESLAQMSDRIFCIKDCELDFTLKDKLDKKCSSLEYKELIKQISNFFRFSYEKFGV